MITPDKANSLPIVDDGNGLIGAETIRRAQAEIDRLRRVATARKCVEVLLDYLKSQTKLKQPVF